MTSHDWILLPAVMLIGFFQLYYLILSFCVRIAPRGAPLSPPDATGKISVVIPVFNSAATLERCLASLLANDLAYVSDIVLALDRCTDASAAVGRSFVAPFAARGVPLELIELPKSRAGKVAGLLIAGQQMRSGTALLMDADIILEPTALAELLTFHRAFGQPFSSCLIYPHQDAGPSTLTTHVICNNRLYRQSVLQSVKNLFGVANFPGGVQMVEFVRYRELLVDGFLEDLTATYQVLATGGEIKVLPRVLAYEIERQTIAGLFLQRLRWTIGAIQHLPTQIRTARLQRSIPRKILVNSYHVMWEFQHYVIALGVVAAPWSPHAWPLLLTPFGLYVLQIGRSVTLTRAQYRNSAAGALLHCLVFPLVISAALVGSVLVLIKQRSYFFGTTLLYRRS
jgi:cellulose synthase/poly-beta-1,6-N-acetylglucosamine synthase-like glycosyltransferase